jgi:KDO2-lipid IV(A) lauroyltransferase
MKNYISYIIFRFFQLFVAVLPFRLLYIFSDVCNLSIYNIFKYRIKTVHKNLKNAFPYKSEKDLKIITSKYYKNLCDVFLESLKGYSSKPEILQKRYKCSNPELLNRYANNDQDVIIAMNHYANWEWGTQVARSFFKHQVVSFYKPLSNEYINKFILQKRTKNGMKMVSIYDSRSIFKLHEDKPKAYFMVGDQSPGRQKKAVWIKFLNQETACIRGIEGYSRLLGLPVILADVQRIKRGFYSITLELLCENPGQTIDGEITSIYMHKLENIIQTKPEDWLWSHKRWKMKNTGKLLIN